MRGTDLDTKATMIEVSNIPYLRLGVNIDHVATIRNARGGLHPDPVAAAHLAAEAGADGITAHLREDRRHISDEDIARLKDELDLPLNLEMAATNEMLEIALRHRPNACCLVPERRQELTTEGGLNVVDQEEILRPIVDKIKTAKIRLSLFIDPDEEQIKAANRLGADIVELHTGTFCDKMYFGNKSEAEIESKRLASCARMASTAGLEVHAGHGLNYDTAGTVSAIPEIVELNIGHFIVGDAIFKGLQSSIQKMRSIMNDARAGLIAQR